MEDTSFHLSRLTICVKTDKNEPEYERRIVRKHLGSSYSRLVIPFEAGIEHWKQEVLARTFANRIRDHYVGLGLTTAEETPSMFFEIMRGPRGGGFVTFRLPRDIHIIPEGLSGLRRMQPANGVPLQRADTDLAYVPRLEDSIGDCTRLSFPLASSQYFIKSPGGQIRLPRNLVGVGLSDDAASPQASPKVSKKYEYSSIPWHKRKESKPKLEKQKRTLDNRPLGLSECENSDDDFILYFDLHNASLSEIARQLSRLVQGSCPQINRPSSKTSTNIYRESQRPPEPLQTQSKESTG